MRKIKKNKLSRAIFLVQKAAQKFPEELTPSSQRQLLEVIKKNLMVEIHDPYHSFSCSV